MRLMHVCIAHAPAVNEYSSPRVGLTNDFSERLAFPARMQKDPQRLPPLDLLASFEACARHLSFTRAAQERFVTQSAMSRQMKALEEDLGVALFRRHHRALALTEQGLRLQQACTQALGTLRTAVMQLRAPQARQALTLTTTPGLASLWLIPRLPRFTREHPGCDVRIEASFQRRDLAAEGFDIAIRYGRPSVVDGVPLFSEALLPVCSPKLMRPGNPPLKTPQDLRLHALLEVASVQRLPGMPLEWDPWLQAAGLEDLQPAAMLTFSGYAEAIAAALAGQGVALGRKPLVDDLLRQRLLVAPFKNATASMRSYILMVEPRSREKPAVRALEQWLLQEARATE